MTCDVLLQTPGISPCSVCPGRGAAALAALANLRTLNLSNTRVNSGALIHFSDMKNLKSLAVYGCHEIGDAGSNASMAKLQDGLPNLRCVRLNNGSDNDGVVSATGDHEDEELDSDSEQIFLSTHDRTGFAFAQPADYESDSDSNMEDAESEEGHESDSSYSDHD